MSDVFFDTNVVLYLLSEDERKAEIAEALIMSGGHASVQVLAEMTNVCRRKFAMGWDAIHDLRELVIRHCEIHALTESIHQTAFSLARTYGYTIYDAQIIASANEAHCTTLWSEDMHSGQRFQRPTTADGWDLCIANPFEVQPDDPDVS